MLELDSPVTLWISILVSVLAIFFVAIFWQQLYKRTFPNFLYRLFVLILCQILILISAGLVINRSNGFYASWNDLFGKGTDYSKVATSTSANSKIDAKFLRSAEITPYGQAIVKEIVKGEKSGISNIVYLVIPRSAVANIENGQPIEMANTKVIELLAGYPSQPEIWFRALDIAKAMDRAEKSNPGVSLIGVIPAVNVAGKADLECMNFPNNGIQTETWLTTDVRNFVNRRLGISPARWGVMGVSTGGWCSAMLSIKHEDLFASAISIAGYYRPALAKSTDPAVAAQLVKDYDFAKLQAAMTGKMNMLLITSKGDRYSYRETTKFQALSHPNINYQYKEIATGGHNARVWISQLGFALNWFIKS